MGAFFIHNAKYNKLLFFSDMPLDNSHNITESFLCN